MIGDRQLADIGRLGKFDRAEIFGDVLGQSRDLRRLAAVEQLDTLGRQLDVPVYSEGPDSNALKVCRQGVQKAKDIMAAWVILDTGGRLHIDDEMMEELEEKEEQLRLAGPVPGLKKRNRARPDLRDRRTLRKVKRSF